MATNILPPKIENLSLFQRDGYEIPRFWVLKSDNAGHIKELIKEIKKYFATKPETRLIIRSASFLEDGDNYSRAGFFESSAPLSVNKLSQSALKSIWRLNADKLKRGGKNLPLFLFIQVFIDFEYSGVLFTQLPYDKNQAMIKLSSSNFHITSGKKAEVEGLYDYFTGQWLFSDNFAAGAGLSGQLDNIIKTAKKYFPDGADIELGLKSGRVIIVQVRPITRSVDEDILAKEKERLQVIFSNNFENQIWERNNFTEALSDLKPLSLSMYNFLFNSVILKKVIFEAGFSSHINNEGGIRILENIGGRTYYNNTEAGKIFSQFNGRLGSVRQLLKIFINEKELANQSQTKKKSARTLEECFAWLFISGLYYQFFLTQEKKNTSIDIFAQKLRNTEALTKATEPTLRRLDKLREFRKRYNYLADNPYELSARRASEMSVGDLKSRYLKDPSLQKSDPNTTMILGKKATFWLNEKVAWREIFLGRVSEEAKNLRNRFGAKIYSASNWEEITAGGDPSFLDDLPTRISGSFPSISGINYPFSGTRESKEELIIVPGEIKIKDLVFLNTSDDPRIGIGKSIAIAHFPNKWIPYIPKYRGIVVKEGNELSHMAITCREYNIPLRVMPEAFTD